MAESRKKLDIQKALGAKPARSQSIVIYLPDKDQNGKKVVDHKTWVKNTKRLLTEINGGATVMPPADGAWQNTETGRTVNENTVVVYSYIRGSEFVRNIQRLREHLHRFGRETNQGVVAFEFDRRFFEIEEFDES